MKDFLNRFKNFGLLELLVIFSAVYVVAMLLWTASTRSAVEEKANIVKSNHKQIVDFINAEIPHGVLIPRVKNYLDSRIIDTRVKFLDFADFVETFRFCKEEINCLNNILTDPTIDVNWISNWLLENSTIMYKKQLQNFLETEFPRRV